jgi:redox-sensitive bicupin YhaK (pirin superfamily)
MHHKRTVTCSLRSEVGKSHHYYTQSLVHVTKYTRTPYVAQHGTDPFRSRPQTDSLGNAGRYGHGDVQWMTAGSGIVHGEMFPLVHDDGDNHLRLFQIWLNLPSAKKMAKPAFVMHWAPDVQRATVDNGNVQAVVWAGTLFGAKGQPPPPDSWAHDDANDVGIYFLTCAPGASVTLPAAKGGASTNRTLYFFEGERVEVGGKVFSSKSAIDLDASIECAISVPAAGAGKETLLLVLQGKPIGEPVAQHGPFVMNTRAEIQQAFSDYQQTRFGGWPWPDDAMTFPKNKPRFALVDGVETLGPGGMPGLKGHHEL